MTERELIKIAQTAVLEGGKPAKIVAKELNKPYSTLLRELNPFDKSAKLGAETVLELMMITGNVDPLRFMADQLGYEVVPKRQSVGSETQMRAANF